MWKTCGLLLILSALVTSKSCKAKKKNRPLCHLAGISTNSQSPTDSNNENYKNGMFILGNDGFTGFLEIGSCTYGRWSGLSQCPTNVSLAQRLNISVFPIDQNASCIGNPSCTTDSSDYGVSFIRQSPYKLNISRDVEPTFFCFIEGRCKPNIWPNWITEDCGWTLQNTSKYFKNDNCKMICMNHTKTCEEASYDPSCSKLDADDLSNINSFEIHNGSVTCFKCGSPLQALPNISVSSNISNLFNKNRTDAGAAVMIMKSLSSLLDVMGNLTEASVTMGCVTGVLQKIQHQSQIKESVFVYSPETGIRILADIAELKNFPNAFTVPKEAAQKVFNNSAGAAFLGVFRFPKMTKDANNSTVLNDEVYAIEMGTPISDLISTINLNFKKAQEVPGIPKCHSWDGNGSKPNWTTEGCHTVVVGDKITCKCKHLTFFAVLMAPPNIIISSSDLVSLTYITYIGCGLSMFFLGIGLFMHFLINKKKSSDSVIVLMNLFMALFMLNLAFLVNEYVVHAKNLNICQVMAAFMHYCLLSSFSWFAMEALHLCLEMAKNSVTIKHYIIKISMAGWVPPALVVSVLFVMGKYGEQTIETESSNVTMCWILDSTVHYVVNIGYYCFVFMFTFSSFIVVLRWLSMLKLVRWSNAGKVRRSGITTIDISTILALCCLLGLTWSISFFSYGTLQIPSYYAFTILNSLQGFLLFIYYLKTSTLFGDPVPSETSDMTEETKTENPYEDTVPADDKMAT